VRLDDSLLVKRLQRLPGGQIKVISDNTSFEAFTVPVEKLDGEFSIIGTVVWAGRRF